LQAQGLSELAADTVAARWVTQIELYHWQSLDRAVQDAHGALHMLASKGVRIRVLTARTHYHWVRVKIREFGFLPFVSHTHVVNPLNAAAEKASVLSQLRPLAFIGDTESDFAAAQMAHVPFQAVHSGMRSESFLAQHCNCRSHHSLSEAINDIGKAP